MIEFDPAIGAATYIFGCAYTNAQIIGNIEILSCSFQFSENVSFEFSLSELWRKADSISTYLKM